MKPFRDEYDLAVIGGGPGGYHAAIFAAQKGLKTLLVEKEALGGTCLNRGCIPTKSFLHDTGLLTQAKSSPVLRGAEGLSLDLAGMVQRKDKVVRTMVGGLAKVMDSYGIQVVQGRGELPGPGRVRAGGADFKARSIILATGSRPAVPGFIKVDGELVQTTDQALAPRSVPARLAIIGGGVIGFEMATIYHELGSEVTILELLPDVLVTEDKELRRMARVLLEQRGVKILLQVQVREVVPRGREVGIRFRDQAGETSALSVDRVLVATGRAPVLEGLGAGLDDGLDRSGGVGLRLRGGFVQVNQRLETNLPGVYAIGDLVGGQMLAHKASAEAEAAVENILGASRSVRPELIPRCIWCRPELAAVGLTEEEAARTGRPIRIGRFSYPNSGKAQAMGEPNGLVKIIAAGDNGQILGVHLLGENATELLGEPLLAMTMESAVEDLAAVIKPHPTLSETVMEAALDWSDLAVHQPKKG